MFNASIRTTPQGWNIVLPTTGYNVSVQTTKEGLHVTGTRTNGRNGHDRTAAITTRAERTPRVTRSPKMVRSRRNQGLYLNALRPLTKANRNRVRKIREEKGVTTAIREARKLAS